MSTNFTKNFSKFCASVMLRTLRLTMSIATPALFFVVSSATSTANHQISNVDSRGVLIEPGLRVGPLRLGDTEEKVLSLFPLKRDVDQWQTYPNCGKDYHWLDLAPHGGDLDIRFKDGSVFQVDSSQPAHHTKEGISVSSSPQAVKEHFEGLDAYELSGTASEAQGRQNLIFWVDHRKGIAFAFSYSLEQRRRKLAKIIVFRPNSDFCPEGEAVDSPNWRKLAPYSLGRERISLSSVRSR